jgi:hypothetical protein
MEILAAIFEPNLEIRLRHGSNAGFCDEPSRNSAARIPICASTGTPKEKSLSSLALAENRLTEMLRLPGS